MTEVELRNFIKAVIRQEIAAASMGAVVSSESTLYGRSKSVGRAGPIETRTISPFGFFSKAPAGVPVAMLPVNGDPSHVNVIGHADPARPDCDEGGVGLYDNTGKKITIKGGKLYFGTESSAEPMVLGTKLEEFLIELLATLATHTHAGPGSPPTEAPKFESQKSKVESHDLVSDKAYTEK